MNDLALQILDGRYSPRYCGIRRNAGRDTLASWTISSIFSSEPVPGWHSCELACARLEGVG
jgi:hypothetical protein